MHLIVKGINCRTVLLGKENLYPRTHCRRKVLMMKCTVFIFSQHSSTFQNGKHIYLSCRFKLISEYQAAVACPAHNYFHLEEAKS